MMKLNADIYIGVLFQTIKSQMSAVSLLSCISFDVLLRPALTKVNQLHE